MVTDDLLKFIRTSLSHGRKWNEIETSLRNNHWKDEDISLALAALTAEPADSPVPRPPESEPDHPAIPKSSHTQSAHNTSIWFSVIIPLGVGLGCYWYFDTFITSQTQTLLTASLAPVKNASLKYPVLIQYFLALSQQWKLTWLIFISLPIALMAACGPLLILFRPNSLPKKTINKLIALAIFFYSALFLYRFFAVAQNGIDKMAANFNISNLVSQIGSKKYPPEITTDPAKMQQMLANRTDPKLTVIYPSDSFARLALQDIYTTRSKNTSPFVQSQFLPQDYQTTLITDNFPLVFLINGERLYIRSIDQASMQGVLPILSHQAVSRYFKNRNLKKNEVKVRIVDEATYLKERDEYIDREIELNTQIIVEDLSSKSLFEQNIANINIEISANQAEINRIVIARDHNYNQCISETNYNYAYLYGYYDEASNSSGYSYCQTQKNYASQAIAPYQTTINELKKQLNEQKAWLSLITDNIDQKSQYIEKMNTFERTGAAYEDGLFISPASIIIPQDSTNPDQFKELLATAVHEQLHYLTFSSTNRLLPTLFDEGFTSYYTQNIMKSVYGIEVSGGYDDLMEDIKQIAANYPPDKLEEIYFKKMYFELYETIKTKFGTKYDEWLINFQ